MHRHHQCNPDFRHHRIHQLDSLHPMCNLSRRRRLHHHHSRRLLGLHRSYNNNRPYILPGFERQTGQQWGRM